MFNVLFFWLSALFFKTFLPIAVCSVVATCASFYGALFVDFLAFNKLKLKYGYSTSFFIFGDFILHLMPLLMIYTKYWQEAIEIIAKKKMTNQALAGLTSILVHMLWFHVNDDMNDLYVHISQNSWLILWNIAIIAHLITMNLLYIKSSF
jgi:hypothetical protein